MPLLRLGPVSVLSGCQLADFRHGGLWREFITTGVAQCHVTALVVGAGNKLDRTGDCKNTNPVVVAITDTW
jgi:hypothetical protein